MTPFIDNKILGYLKRLKTLYTNQNNYKKIPNLKNKTGTWCVWLINAGGLHKKWSFSFFASLITMTSAIHSGCSLPPTIPKRTKLIIPSPSQTPPPIQCHLIYILVSLCHLYGEVTITGEGLQILTYAQHLWPLSSEDSLACHTYWDTGHLFIMIVSEDPWHSDVLSSGCLYTVVRRTLISQWQAYHFFI